MTTRTKTGWTERLFGAAPSLRRRLMLFLLGAVSLAALLQGWSSYRTALQEADEIFDYQMQQMALSMTGGSYPQGLPQELELVIQAWTADGLQVFRSGVPLPQRAVLGFTNVEAEGKHYRVLSVQRGGQVLQLAQDLAVRQRLAGRLALRTIMPIAIMLPVLMLIVGWVVRGSLAPVERVRRQLAERAARAAEDLAPVAAGGLPAEIRPMVDELNSLLGRVRQSFEAQQHFVADAAHELRSPLTALKLQVQALQRAGDEQGRTLAQTRLAAGIDRASHLVEQLLLLARQETAPAALEPVALEPLLRQLMGEQVALAQARQIDLGLLRADAVQVPGRADALAVALRNLLDNAIKYTPPGGKVDVMLLDEGQGQVRLRLEDSGPGIPAAERERVFDRFYRSAEAQAATGSGLGLAIVKAIAERHGARLLLDRSEALGGLRVDLLFSRT